jgi:hypothetical protein
MGCGFLSNRFANPAKRCCDEIRGTSVWLKDRPVVENPGEEGRKRKDVPAAVKGEAERLQLQYSTYKWRTALDVALLV